MSDHFVKITSAQNVTSVMTNRAAIVAMSKVTASFFLPSMYQRIGLPITSDPVIAAERMNKSNITIGNSTVSFWSIVLGA